MRKIEASLNDIHSQNLVYFPFAFVELVSEGSPGSLAGIQVGDQIIHFGKLNCKNVLKIADIAEFLQINENVIKLSFPDETFDVVLSNLCLHNNGLLKSI